MRDETQPTYTMRSNPSRDMESEPHAVRGVQGEHPWEGGFNNRGNQGTSQAQGKLRQTKAHSLRVATLNIDGFRDHKIPLVCEKFKSLQLDVLVLIDTRITVKTAEIYKESLRERLGNGLKVLAGNEPPILRKGKTRVGGH